MYLTRKIEAVLKSAFGGGGVGRPGPGGQLHNPNLIKTGYQFHIHQNFKSSFFRADPKSAK
jgi:hypothetical protein